MELLVLGALALAAFIVFAILAWVFGLVVWLVFLPFRILGWMFKAVTFLLAIPFLAIFGLVALLVFGAGMLMFLLPVLPLALLALGAWWLVRRSQRSAAAATR